MYIQYMQWKTEAVFEPFSYSWCIMEVMFYKENFHFAHKNIPATDASTKTVEYLVVMKN